jgi:hypothetical protein
MNNRFRLILEFAWVAVLIMSLAALTVSAIRAETRNIIVFSIIAVISLSMYMLRRSQRKKT